MTFQWLIVTEKSKRTIHFSSLSFSLPLLLKHPVHFRTFIWSKICFFSLFFFFFFSLSLSLSLFSVSKFFSIPIGSQMVNLFLWKLDVLFVCFLVCLIVCFLVWPVSWYSYSVHCICFKQTLLCCRDSFNFVYFNFASLWATQKLFMVQRISFFLSFSHFPVALNSFLFQIGLVEIKANFLLRKSNQTSALIPPFYIGEPVSQWKLEEQRIHLDRILCTW